MWCTCRIGLMIIWNLPGSFQRSQFNVTFVVTRGTLNSQKSEWSSARRPTLRRADGIFSTSSLLLSRALTPREPLNSSSVSFGEQYGSVDVWSTTDKLTDQWAQTDVSVKGSKFSTVRGSFCTCGVFLQCLCLTSVCLQSRTKRGWTVM